MMRFKVGDLVTYDNDQTVYEIITLEDENEWHQGNDCKYKYINIIIQRKFKISLFGIDSKITKHKRKTHFTAYSDNRESKHDYIQPFNFEVLSKFIAHLTKLPILKENLNSKWDLSFLSDQELQQELEERKSNGK